MPFIAYFTAVCVGCFGLNGWRVHFSNGAQVAEFFERIIFKLIGAPLQQLILIFLVNIAHEGLFDNSLLQVIDFVRLMTRSIVSRVVCDCCMVETQFFSIVTVLLILHCHFVLEKEVVLVVQHICFIVL